MATAPSTPSPLSPSKRASTRALSGFRRTTTTSSLSAKQLEMLARKSKVEAQLKARDKAMRHSCLLHPSESAILPWWDFATTIALVYTALVTPFECAFVSLNPAVNPWADPWFLINRIIDVIFLLDMITRACNRVRPSIVHRLCAHKPLGARMPPPMPPHAQSFSSCTHSSRRRSSRT